MELGADALKTHLVQEGDINMDMACHHCKVFNDLDSWTSEKLSDGWYEIECPSCGALHHAKKSNFNGLNVYLVEDNG